MESLTQSLCDLAMSFAEARDQDEDEEERKRRPRMSRPFGVSLLIAGADARGPQLLHMDPSGTYVAYDAHAIGAGSEGAITQLQEKYNKAMSLEQGKALVTRVLAVRGARPSPSPAKSGTTSGSRLRSTLPLGESGSVSRMEQVAGTM